MSEEHAATPPGITPIRVEQRFLDGEGLTAGDASEFEEEGITSEDTPDAPGEEAPGFGVHNFHTGKIMVSVYEAGPGKVRIEGSLYDEFVQILEGRLILTPDGGEAMEFRQGDSLVVPKGYTGYWDMPEKYRELIIINADYNEDAEGEAE